MKKSEREALVIVAAALWKARDAVMTMPSKRGEALGHLCDSIEAIESMLADKKDANEKA